MNSIKRTNVVSSDIESIGYDKDEEILEIVFKKGGTVYRYYKVPYEFYFNLMAAKSHGKFLFINSSQFTYEKMEVNV